MVEVNHLTGLETLVFVDDVGWGESSEPTAESFVKSPVGGGELARGERSRGVVGVVKAEEERVGVEAFEEFWVHQSVRRFGGI